MVRGEVNCLSTLLNDSERVVGAFVAERELVVPLKNTARIAKKLAYYTHSISRYSLAYDLPRLY